MRTPAAYLRLSPTPREQPVSIEAQRELAQALCRERGWPAPVLYTDESVSGSKDVDRPERDRLEAAIKAGAHAALIVKSVDRLARSTADFARLVKVCKEADTVLVVQDLGVDTSTPTGALVAGIMAQLAEFEAAQIGQRVALAHAYRAAHGRAPVGPPAYGTANAPGPDGGKVRVLDDDAAAVIRDRMVPALLAGQSLRAIARELNAAGVLTPQDHLASRAGRPGKGAPWSAEAVRGVLSNPALVGHANRKGDVLRDVDGLPRVVSPPIIDPATYAEVRRILAARAGVDRRRTATFHERLLLDRLACCAGCGAPMKRQAPGGARKLSYTCSRRGRLACSAPVTIESARLDAHVVSEFLSTLGFFAVTRVEDDADPALLARLEGVRAEVAATLDALSTAGAADVPALAERLTTLRTAEAAAAADLSGKPLQRLVDTGQTFREHYEALDSDPERRAFLASAIDRITVSRGSRHVPLSERVEVVWRR